MKKISLLLFSIFVVIHLSCAQNYPNIVNYNLNGTPTNGIKIKTNIPFVASSQMPTITILGFNYGKSAAIGLLLNFYIYSSTGISDASNYFYIPKITSFGAYTPQIYLSNENGLVTILINDKPYFSRFTVSAFAQGMSETSTQYQGWTVVDEALSGTKSVLVPYQGQLTGEISLPGGGMITSDGKIGIGTQTPDAKLTVNGTIHSKEVKVDTSIPVPDYVFEADYKLSSLEDIKVFVEKNHHLPEIPSAKQIEKEGIDLGIMNMKLLKKVEELTLYLIEKDGQVNEQSKQLKEQHQQLEEQRKVNKSLQDQINKLIDKK